MVRARTRSALLITVVLLTAPAAAVPLPPAITSGPSSPTNQTSASFAFGDGGAGVALLCSLDDAGSFVPCDSDTAQVYPGPLAAGPHVFRLKATDGADESATVSFAWTIDPGAPRLTLTSAPVDPSIVTTASFAFFADETAAFTCDLDGQGAAACDPDPSDPNNATKGTKTYSGLADGAHVFTVTARDAGGTIRTVDVHWTIALAAPALAITAAPPAPTASNAAMFRFASADASTFACQLDGALPGPWLDCEIDPDDATNPATGAMSYAGLSDGSYTFTVTATDPGGNVSSRALVWLVDSVPPDVLFDAPTPAPNGSGWNNTDVSIAFAIEDTEAGVDGGGSTASPLLLSSEGAAVTAVVTARDNAGNMASIISPAVNIDRTPPAISITAPGDGAVFPQGQGVAAAYACSDTLSGVEACNAPVASGSNIDTASLGPGIFTVQATDRAGNSATRSTSYTVIPAIPDLVQTAPSNPPALALPGSSFSITDAVQNQGGAASPVSTTRYYLSLDPVKDATDVLLVGTRSVPTLAIGGSSAASTTLAIPSATPFRKYYLLACADDPGSVAEIDESNNCRASTSQVHVTRPDLVATTVSNPPPAAAPRGTLRVIDTVLNQGLLAAPASKTGYYLSTDAVKGSSDVHLSGSRSVPALDAGAQSGDKAVTVTIPATAPLGTYYLLACADDTALVLETEENNNCVASSTTMVVTRPDLVQTTVSNPPPAATPGASFKLTDTALNQGLVAAAASTTRYYVSLDLEKGPADALLTGSRSVPGLAPGASSAGATVSVTVPTSLALGSYYLLACADDMAVVVEIDELNNCFASATRVEVTRPDLVTIAVSNPPATAVRGGSMKVNDTVQNRGSVAAGSTTTRYYLAAHTQRSSGDVLLTGSRSVPGLAGGAVSAGATVTLKIPTGTPTGPYYLLACADDLAAVAETDETNNCLASAGQVSITP